MGVTTAVAAVASAGSSIYKASQAGDQASNIENTGAAQSAADPFAQERPYYQGQLKQLETSDDRIGDLANMPGYKAGLDAVTRSQAAMGYLGSGNMATALLDYGGNIYNQRANFLARLAGVDIGSPGTAGQLNQQGKLDAAQLRGQAVNTRDAGISGLTGALGKAFNGYLGGGQTSVDTDNSFTTVDGPSDSYDYGFDGSDDYYGGFD